MCKDIAILLITALSLNVAVFADSQEEPEEIVTTQENMFSCSFEESEEPVSSEASEENAFFAADDVEEEINESFC